MKVRALSMFACAAVAAVAVAGCANGSDGANRIAAPAAAASTSDRPDMVPGLAARGTGRVEGTPDTLRVVLGVETRGQSAKGTLGENSQKAKALVDTLKDKGVEAKDIQTSQLQIQPTYDEKGQRITGYQVTNQVTATLHDLAGAGALIDAAAEAVGDAVRVQSMGFSIDDDSALRGEARTQAVHQAQIQAEQMAKAAGVKRGRIRSISEVFASGPVPYYEKFAGAPSADARVAAPIEPGSQELSLMVDAIWDIEQ